jgi:hypothetical protein
MYLHTNCIHILIKNSSILYIYFLQNLFSVETMSCNNCLVSELDSIRLNDHLSDLPPPPQEEQGDSCTPTTNNTASLHHMTRPSSLPNGVNLNQLQCCQHDSSPWLQRTMSASVWSRLSKNAVVSEADMSMRQRLVTRRRSVGVGTGGGGGGGGGFLSSSQLKNMRLSSLHSSRTTTRTRTSPHISKDKLDMTKLVESINQTSKQRPPGREGHTGVVGQESVGLGSMYLMERLECDWNE